MKKTLFLCIFLVFGQILYAQQDSTQSTPAKEKNYQIYTWDVGTDIRPLLNSGANYGSLMFRRNFSKITKDSKIVYRAYRFSAGFKYLATTGTSPNTRDFELSFLFGKEYQKPFKKFQFFYGYDIYTSLGYDLKQVQTSNNLITNSNYLISYVYASLGYFMGVKYFISPRFMILWESGGDFFVGTRLVEPRLSNYGFLSYPTQRLNFHFFFK